MKFTIKKITYKKHLKPFEDILCKEGIAYFKRKFPDGMSVNRENLMKIHYGYFNYFLMITNSKLCKRWDTFVASETNGRDRNLDVAKRVNKVAMKIFCDKFLPKKK